MGWSSAGGVISPVLFSLYVNDIPTPFRYIELALYADDTALVPASKHLALLVKYLETHLSELEIWLRKWRIAINVGKSAVYSLRLDVLHHLVLSGFSEKRFDGKKNSNIWGSPWIADLPGLVT